MQPRSFAGDLRIPSIERSYVGLIIGLLLAGGGVVPVAFLAALFHGKWALLGFVVLGTVLTFGTRLLGLRLTAAPTSREDELAVEAGAG